MLVGTAMFDAAHHVPVLIYPNPLNPKRYVVLNSGFTFREYDYLNNARAGSQAPGLRGDRHQRAGIGSCTRRRRNGGVLHRGVGVARDQLIPRPSEGPSRDLGRDRPSLKLSMHGLPSGNLAGIVNFMKQLLRELANALFIILGILSAGMGIHGFLISSHFIDGGVTGISMLVSKVLGIPLPILVLAINMPFIGLGYRQIGRTFAIRSALAIMGLSLCLATVHYPDVTPDKLLTAVFGGFFIGAGMGLAMRGGAVLDGTDIAALLISKKSHLFRVGDVILGLNIVIFLTAEFFLGVEPALYSILTYLSATKTLDFLLHGLEEYTAITIVSERSAAIREALTLGLGRGVTVYKGRGGMSGADQEILFCVVTRLEIGKVMNIVEDLDDSAFITIGALAEVKGGVLRKTAHH